MVSTNDTQHVLDDIIAAVADLPGFAAIALGGSAATGLADENSDLDLHVYWRAPLAAPAERAARLARVAGAAGVEVDILDWGREDHVRVDGRLVELVYVPLDELRAEVEQAYAEGLISEGYTTARLFYVASGRPLHDPAGELSALRERLLAAYPEPTRRLLLRYHPALLRVYLGHLRLAQARGDLLAVQHRRYTVQMVFFNLLFALNRHYHPGEKRLLIHSRHCTLQPAGLAARWSLAARLAADDPKLAQALGDLVDDLCALIEVNQ
jgi:predicted nucleotidyltransferase